jgi:hypothetical protein
LLEATRIIEIVVGCIGPGFGIGGKGWGRWWVVRKESRQYPMAGLEDPRPEGRVFGSIDGLRLMAGLYPRSRFCGDFACKRSGKVNGATVLKSSLEFARHGVHKVVYRKLIDRL